MSVLDYGSECVSVGFEETGSEDWAERVYGPEIKAKWHELYKQPGYSI